MSEPAFTTEVLEPALTHVHNTLKTVITAAKVGYVIALIGRKSDDPKDPRGCVFGSSVPDETAAQVLDLALHVLAHGPFSETRALGETVLKPIARSATKALRNKLNLARFDFLLVLVTTSNERIPAIVITSTFPDVRVQRDILEHYLRQRQKYPDRIKAVPID